MSRELKSLQNYHKQTLLYPQRAQRHNDVSDVGGVDRRVDIDFQQRKHPFHHGRVQNFPQKDQDSGADDRREVGGVAWLPLCYIKMSCI